MKEKIKWVLFRVECPTEFIKGCAGELWLKNQVWKTIAERIGEQSHIELRLLTNQQCSAEQIVGNVAMTCRFEMSKKDFDRDFRTEFSEPFDKVVDGKSVSIMVQYILKPYCMS